MLDPMPELARHLTAGILALIFIQYKQANKGIKIEKYTRTEKIRYKNRYSRK